MALLPNHSDASDGAIASMKAPVIDAHVHVWKVEEQPWTRDFPALQRSFDLADLAQVARAHRVDGCIVVQAGDSRRETIELLKQSAQSRVVAGVVGWVQLDQADVDAQLAELRNAVGAPKLVGVRHQLQLEADQAWITRAEVRRGLGRLATLGLSFDVVVSAAQLPAVLETVRAVPQTRFVLDHAGKPPIASGQLDLWRANLTALAACPNVAVKLSGLVTEADRANWRQDQLDPVIDHVLESFGAARTMIGSDWPVSLLAADYAQVQDTTRAALDCLNVADRSAVLGGTALDWYGVQWS